MNLKVAEGSMRLIAEMGKAGFLENAGISKGDFDRLVGGIQWRNEERQRMTTALQTLIYGSVDSMGLPRFPLFAEYCAAGVAMFVHPVNIHAACVFLADTSDAENMARNPDSRNRNKTNAIAPDQLFALVCDLWSSEGGSYARALFEKKSGLILQQLEKTGASKK